MPKMPMMPCWRRIWRIGATADLNALRSLHSLSERTLASFLNYFKQEAGCTTGTADIEVTQRKMLVVCVI